MEHVEIERRFLIDEKTDIFKSYPKKRFVQGYLSVEPVLRVRMEGDGYFVTYKGRGHMVREEYNLPLTEEAFKHLIKKADGIIIEKTRYFIPGSEGKEIEVDVFEGELAPLVIAEVEFSSVEEAEDFIPPDWFGREVTEDFTYSNSYLSRNGLRITEEEIK